MTSEKFEGVSTVISVPPWAVYGSARDCKPIVKPFQRVAPVTDGRASSACRALFVAGDVVVHLARAEDEPADALVVGAGIVEHRGESALGQVSERRGGLLQAQQPFRCHHDQRAGTRLERLPAQQVEVLSRG